MRGVHIKGSPWTVYVSPTATHPPTSVMWGGGLTFARVLDTSIITIQARDRFDNNRTLTTDFLQLIFTGPPRRYVKYSIEAHNNGYYTVSYVPQGSGDFVVQVFMNAVQIKGAIFAHMFQAESNCAINLSVVLF